MNIENYIKEMQSKLIELGYAGRSVDYEELKQLQQTYGKEMSEKDFALEVLEITDSNYDNVRIKEHEQRYYIKVLN